MGVYGRGLEKLNFQVFRFLGISGLRDRSWRILRKISVPNDPFLWRLLTAVSRKLGTEDFLLNVWRIPRCSFSQHRSYSFKGVILLLILWSGKTAPWNSPNFEQKIFRTKFAGHGGRRRHKNGSFGTEFFRRIRPEKSRSPEIPKKQKT